MKMIENLKHECWGCDGAGYVIEETTGAKEPWLHNEVHLTCEKCEGIGYDIDKDELEHRIDEIKDMLEGMRVRMRLHSDMIKSCEKGLLHELSQKYVYKLDTCARGYARLKQIESKLELLN